MSITTEQGQVVDLAREFARTRIDPAAAEWDRTARFPEDVVRELGQLGFMGLLTPEEHDGLGLGALTYVLALEELAAADAGIAVSVNAHQAVQSGFLLAHATPAQQERWLGPLARGDALATLALAEPEAGSDVAALSTEAVRDRDDWVLTGKKAWVTNGAAAKHVVVIARTAAGPTAFVASSDTRGYRPGPPVDTMGLKSASFVPVSLEGMRLGADQLLGASGRALDCVREAADIGRLGTAAVSVGIARRALELAVGYCAERRQFGRALREFEALQFKLADMATRVAAARALTHQAATHRDQGAAAEVTRSASMAKLFASETAMWVTTQAVQLYGGYGYMRDFPVEKLFRDAKAMEILDGTSEIQRLVVAGELYAGR